MAESKKILNIFYEDIIPSASKSGIIMIDGIKYHINFNTRIENQKISITDSNLPLLDIKNIEVFNKYLVNYINKSSEVFDDPKFDVVKERVCGFEKDDQIKYLLTVLFANCQEEDFKDPINYLRRQMDFIENDQLSIKYNEYTKLAHVTELNDSTIEVVSTTQEPTLETPYVFCSRLVKKIDGNKEYYDLPNISYGISDDTVYIYTIKGKKKKDSNSDLYAKKINRELYKINKDVIPSDEYLDYKNGNSDFYPENVIDVTHSSVLALTIFLGVLKKENYNKVVAVDYLPLRYLSKSESNISRLNSKGIDDEVTYNEELEKIEEDLDYKQNNITNKFIRTFERVSYHLGNINVYSYPGDIDNSMHLKINDNMNDNDHLINKVYAGVAGMHNKESRR